MVAKTTTRHADARRFILPPSPYPQESNSQPQHRLRLASPHFPPLRSKQNLQQLGYYSGFCILSTTGVDHSALSSGPTSPCPLNNACLSACASTLFQNFAQP